MFRVRWKKSASNAMTSLWLMADSYLREAITRAVRTIDLRLASDPLNQGESRPDNRRIDFVEPLGYLYRVDETNFVVRVLQVWRVQ